MKARALLGQACVLLTAVVWVGPYVWMLLTSLKTLPELLREPLAPFPKTVNFAAYREVWRTVPMGRYLMNTTIMASLIASLQIALALPAGFALAKLHFVGKRAAFGWVMVCLLVPAQATFVPVFLLLGGAGWVNTMAGLVVPFGASALGTFLVRQALLSVPDEIIEAARLDGASDLYVVYRMLAPLLRPTLTALFLLSFVFHWNDYFWPLVMTTDDHVRTVPLAIALLREQGTGVRWHLVMAGNVILSGPVLVVFALTQKHLVRAVAAKRL
ncbi:MAG TPA: carbohydrate ABC transporter permease [Polyangiaceae bacterium]|nr:carbohydrate ABC transporter permease [Polyangiaceae bacterium]